MFPIYKGLRVLVTGHTGFKGAWLCEWLKREGAEVFGLALAPERDGPNLFDSAEIALGMVSKLGDIRDFDVVRRAVSSAGPDVVLHLAAQALVRRSYREPIETLATNIMGTAHVLEAARQEPSVRAVVCVTTDKVYKNREWVWGYRESDHLGGKDPYSASKAGAELVAAAYQSTMMPLAGNTCVATARGGNVVGGGDWCEDRLIPDVVRALVSNKEIVLRNPDAVRPWQHVLDLCRAYLQLGALLLQAPERAKGAWNFGPIAGSEVEVGRLVEDFCRWWGAGAARVRVESSSLNESAVLRLDPTKAMQMLGWRPLLSYDKAIEWTAEWYRQFHLRGEPAKALIDAQLSAYLARVAA